MRIKGNLQPSHRFFATQHQQGCQQFFHAMESTDAIGKKYSNSYAELV